MESTFYTRDKEQLVEQGNRNYAEDVSSNKGPTMADMHMSILGNETNVGEVVNIQGYNNETSRSMAVVKWTSGFVEGYKVGHDGRVDIKCILPSLGGCYYRDHLPMLGKGSLPHVMAAQVGLRVIREDGFVGTITEVRLDTTNLPSLWMIVVVQWDSGMCTNYRFSSAILNRLRVMDNATVGVIHPNITCKSCLQIGFAGFKWSCSQCVNYDLCTPCYMNDKHNLSHSFRRYESPSSPGVELIHRLGSDKIQSQGIFPGAKVVLWIDSDAEYEDDDEKDYWEIGEKLENRDEDTRSTYSLNLKNSKSPNRMSSQGLRSFGSSPNLRSPNSPSRSSNRSLSSLTSSSGRKISSSSTFTEVSQLKNDDDDDAISLVDEYLQRDGENDVGEVLAIRGFRNQTERSAALVKWGNGVTAVYKLGHEGRVELKYVQESSGGYYYRDHLPILGNFSIPNSMPISVGLRVAYGSNWKLNQPGEGNIGTIIGIKFEQGSAEPDGIHVQWDSGKLHFYGINSILISGLRVFDIAPIGIIHPNITCKGCHEIGFSGFRWKCNSCLNYNLCSNCYMGDKHNLNHSFLRYETSEKSTGTKMSKRIYSVKIEAKGIFAGAKVVKCEEMIDTVPENMERRDFEPEIRRQPNIPVVHQQHVRNLSQSFRNENEDMNLLKEITEKFPALKTEPGIRRNKEVWEENSVGELLVKTASEGKLEEVEDILRYFPSKVDYLSDHTALQAACLMGNVPMIRLLLSRNANTEIKDDYGYTALHYTVFGSNLEAMEVLLKNRANVEATDKTNRTALHMAVIKQNVPCVKRLITHGSDINAQDTDGNTALHIAISKENIEIIDMILNHPMTNYLLKNNDGSNVYFYALLKGSPKITRRLYERALFTKDMEISYWHDSYGDFNESIDGQQDDDVSERGKNPLFLAVRKGDCALVEYIVNQGVDVNATDEYGNLPLHIALMKYMKQYSSTIVQEHEAPTIFSILEEFSRNGIERNGFLAISCFLAQKQSNLSHRNIDGVTPCDIIKKVEVLTLLEYFSSLESDEDRYQQNKSFIQHERSSSGGSIPQSPDRKSNVDNFSEIQTKLVLMETALKCTVCMKRPLSVAFLCGHRMCGTCANYLDTCHICLQPITQRINLC